MMKKVLGLIPAKGGSTRLPRKNILPLRGKPLLQWAGDALRAGNICDRIVVSTEDEEIANIARDAGFDAPYMRPLSLARDPAGVEQVALHCLETMKSRGELYDILIITLPTSPFVTAMDFKAAYKIFQEQNADFLMSVSLYSHTPFAALKLENGTVSPWFPDYFGRKSQAMPNAYRPNGAIHILNVPAFEKTKSYVSSPLYAYDMPWPRSLDIDTAADFALAEALLQSGEIQ
jgi:CMP-N-acetylneuraminic acid synthetase